MKAIFTPPWSLRIEDRAPLSIIIVLHGTAIFTGAQGPVPVAAGDIVLARGPTPYTLADASDTPSQIRILPDQVCVDPMGHLLHQPMNLGVRTWGNSHRGETTMLIGTYNDATEVGNQTLLHLPTEVVLKDVDSTLIPLLAAEISRDSPGQATVLDRLLDLLLITSLRTALSTTPEHPPSWYAAQKDPLTSQVIRLMHHHPEHPWSVASLASACGVSRATLARRFSKLVGEAPMTFLTNWRLAIAADLLADPTLTISSVATSVGYNNAFALSTAFKRAYGIPPTQYRQQAHHSRSVS